MKASIGDMVRLAIPSVDGIVEVDALPVESLFVNADPGAGWNVSHRSGFAIASKFASREAAIGFAREVSELADWSLPAKQLRYVRDLQEQVGQLARQHGADITGTCEKHFREAAAVIGDGPAPGEIAL